MTRDDTLERARVIIEREFQEHQVGSDLVDGNSTTENEYEMDDDEDMVKFESDVRQFTE